MKLLLTFVYVIRFLTLVLVSETVMSAEDAIRKLKEVTEIPNHMANIQHAGQFMVALEEVLTSHTKYIKNIDEENKALTETMYKLVNENKALTWAVEKLATENKDLTAMMETLAIKSKAMYLKNQDQDEEISKLQSRNKELSDLLKLQTVEIMKSTNRPQLQTSKDVTAKQHADAFTHDLPTDSGYSKRIILHSDTDILRVVTDHNTQIQKLQTDVAALKSGMPKGGSGSTYVRWGRNNGSGNGTELVYSGFAAGSHFTSTGAASNYICLSPDPIWGHYNDAHDAGATVFGTEYQFDGSNPTAYFHKNIHDEDAPCSVCRTRRTSVIMIPGRNQCYKGWTLEYKGYLVAGYSQHSAASEYVCLDDYPDVIPGGHDDRNGKLFHIVEGRCGSLTCPPYVDGRELTCVVCSK